MVFDSYCEICNYHPKRKSDFVRHLKTKKHEKTHNKWLEEREKCAFPPHNSTLRHTTPHKSAKYECEFCLKAFSRSDSLYRHKTKYCSSRLIIENQSQEIQSLKQQMTEQKEIMMKQIENLIGKVGNNNNNVNITQNIQLNNYGNEDLSHISTNMKTEFLKMPLLMIPRMIEEVHFSGSKPENKNIMIVNKKDKFIKIFNNGKWIYKDKDETLNDLIDGKYFILDEHYSDIESSEHLNNNQKQLYETFRNKFDDKNNKDLIDNVKKQCELALLNNRL